MNKNLEELTSSLQTGFINKLVPSSKEFRPEILLNNQLTGSKVLTTILRQLNRCNEFWFSVAFLRMSGFACLVNTLQELEEKGIKGKILVSKYLNFTQPDALRHLLKFSNINLKIGDFHSKGYLFKRDDLYDLIIGSSNLTSDALCSNTEMNLKVSATKDSELISNAINQFDDEFNKGIVVDDLFINEYEEIFNSQSSHDYLINQKSIELKPKEVKPNKMQVEALQKLELLRSVGKKKALIISATGTGKTFLCAFDVKSFGAKKFLFIVHRGNIAHAAMDTFKTVFGDSLSMGVYSGNRREKESDFIFSTVQTISKREHLEQFSPNHFDYIVIDETHRAGAKSYNNIIDYFEPQFLLGMTATPERTDGADIFQLFNHNIAYEIRLHKALYENMLCPFHYYGITDITVNGELLDEHSDFNLLTSDGRIEHIIDRLSFYGCDDGKPKGLIFCSRNAESRELSNGFNERGFKTIALSGKNTEEERKVAIRDLEAGNLEYIFTVDIFNEGIDIPVLNQIIMLRPTQSAIIFVQQLGRGLRKLDNKDYLTVIDFIGNYSNNYLIAIALHGDTSYNKDSIRKCMKDGISGPSTINFDRISKEKIFASIDSANMQTKRELVTDYKLLKYKIGKIPTMIDFREYGSRDPFLYVNKYKSYYNFVAEIEQDIDSSLNSKQVKLLEFFSSEINNAKRIEETWMLKKLISDERIDLSDYKDFIFDTYNYSINSDTIQSCINNLNFEFITVNHNGRKVTARERYDFNIISKSRNEICFDYSMIEYLRNNTFKSFLLDTIEYAVRKYENDLSDSKYIDGFILYKKYSRKDTLRILNWKKEIPYLNIGGYKISDDGSNCPIFVNYEKHEDISSTTKYEDKFLNSTDFQWMSKSRRTLESNDVQAIRNSHSSGMRMPLFVKKHNGEGQDFYYMGDVTPIEDSFIEKEMLGDNGKPVKVVQLVFKISHEVEYSLLDYFINE